MNPRNQTGPAACPLSLAAQLSPSRSRPFPSGNSFIAHVSSSHLVKHSAGLQTLSQADVSVLDLQLAAHGKKVCTGCWKVCTTRRAHKCATPAAATAPRSPAHIARRSSATRAPLRHAPRATASGTLGRSQVARALPEAVRDNGAGPHVATSHAAGVTGPAGTHRAAPADLDDWPELLRRLRPLRHTFIPTAVSQEYRLLLTRLLRNFNRAASHVRRDLALRTLVAATCVTTRDIYRYEPGRRSISSRTAAMRRRIRRAADGGVESLLSEADHARQD